MTHDQSIVEGPNPSGLCLCGCGEKTTVALRSNKRLGHVLGFPVRYKPGHVSRRRYRTPEEFWSLVDKRTDDFCWEWQGNRGHAGYGRTGWRGRVVMAHRVSYELTHGSIPAGLSVLHRCDNPACVRPDHLFLGTHVDNMIDMRRKNRHAPPPMLTLTADDLIFIRSHYVPYDPEFGAKPLANRFGVSAKYVSMLANKR